MDLLNVRLAVLVTASALFGFGADPLSSIKALDDDAVGSSVLSAIGACQHLAPSPFGRWVPSNVTLTVQPSSVTIPARTISGPFPVTIPAQTLPTRATTTTIPGTAFLPPAPRVCNVSLSGNSGGSPPHPQGKSTFTMSLNIDFSTYLSNGSGGGCSQASGLLTFIKADNGNSQDQLTMTHAGLVCDTAGIGSAKTYSASYKITGGTRKYSGADGTGSVSASFDAARSLLHLLGNVRFQ